MMGNLRLPQVRSHDGKDGGLLEDQDGWAQNDDQDGWKDQEGHRDQHLDGRLLCLFLSSLASLGFGHTEAGNLHAERRLSAPVRLTQSDIGLWTLQLQRLERTRAYADGFGIERRLAERIYDAAVNEGIDIDLAFRLVKVESSFRQRAVGPAGSIGFTQVQPRTARWLDPSVSREDLFETETNLRLGFRYLKMLLDRYRSTRMALLAYNRGPATVATVLAAGEDPANGYARRVLSVKPAR